MLPKSGSLFHFKKKERSGGKEREEKIVEKGQIQYAFEWQSSLQFELVKVSPYNGAGLLLRWMVEIEKGVIPTKISGHIYTLIFLTQVL